ncbi:MAG: hypothetical protein JST19_00205 [Bacteroidetes bacterium]|nr:hypothetical protein [Bacteroidota bacterium]
MLSVYYKIWVDAIKVTQSSKSEGKNWKIFTIIPISLLMGINLATVLIWIRAFSYRKFVVVLPVNIFDLNAINTFISLALTFFAPFVILNYLLIFNRERYSMLLKIYRPERSGKRYFWYAGISVGILVVPYLLKLIF